MNCITGAFWKKSICPRFPAHRLGICAGLPPLAKQQDGKAESQTHRADQDLPAVSGCANAAYKTIDPGTSIRPEKLFITDGMFTRRGDALFCFFDSRAQNGADHKPPCTI